MSRNAHRRREVGWQVLDQHFERVQTASGAANHNHIMAWHGWFLSRQTVTRRGTPERLAAPTGIRPTAETAENEGLGRSGTIRRATAASSGVKCGTVLY